jgi:hypothetical protein
MAWRQILLLAAKYLLNLAVQVGKGLPTDVVSKVKLSWIATGWRRLSPHLVKQLLSVAAFWFFKHSV